MRQKLNLITLGVKNFKKSVDFYERVLGWKKSAASVSELALFPLGGMVLALHPRQALADDATVPETGSGFRGITLSYNATSEAEVDQVLKEVEKGGARIMKPAQKVYWGGYSGYFADPDGFLIEVAYNPFWKLDDNFDIVLPE